MILNALYQLGDDSLWKALIYVSEVKDTVEVVNTLPIDKLCLSFKPAEGNLPVSLPLILTFPRREGFGPFKAIT